MADRDWFDHAIHLGLAAAIMQERIDRRKGEKEDRLDDAKDDYYRSLRALERATGDQALKEEAFIRGIIYAGLMRDAGRADDFDEATVTGQIERVLRTGQASGGGTEDSAVDRLRELERVREAGLITDEEYDQKRREILDSI